MSSAGTCETVLISLISNYEDSKYKEFHVIPKPLGKLNCGRIIAIFVLTVIRRHPNQMMATNVNGSFLTMLYAFILLKPHYPGDPIVYSQGYLLFNSDVANEKIS